MYININFHDMKFSSHVLWFIAWIIIMQGRSIWQKIHKRCCCFHQCVSKLQKDLFIGFLRTSCHKTFCKIKGNTCDVFRKACLQICATAPKTDQKNKNNAKYFIGLNFHNKQWTISGIIKFKSKRSVTCSFLNTF